MNAHKILDLVIQDVDRHEQPKSITELRACLSNCHYLEMIGVEDVDQEDLEFLDWLLMKIQLGEPPTGHEETINMIKSIINKPF